MPLPRPKILDDIERFMSFIERLPWSGCWIWLGTGGEYGHFWIDGGNKLAHRFSWELFKGPIGELQVCHSCDIRYCVNPNHLYLGTQADNIRDASRKGRLWYQGQTHCKRGHELTEDNIYSSEGYRRCRQCVRDRQTEYYKALRNGDLPN